MILTNRLFVRVAPSREAKSIYIFCEGKKREFDYFKYFKAMDSRINIEIYKLHNHEDNSPSGLLAIAEKCIIKTEENANPKYNFIEGDEVWIVLDIDKDKDDSRLPKIEIVKEKCQNYENWHLAQSNPCFEVWLYYHFHSTKPVFANSDKCVYWKRLVNESILGGFHSSRHPIYIETASKNAERNFKTSESNPDIGSTNVYELANIIIPLVNSKLKMVLKDIED
jgi:hypothetical protein